MSTPSSSAMASALAIPVGVSSRICTTIWLSSAGFSSRAGVGRMPSCGTMAVWERCPRGGNRHALATRRASSTVSMRGAMIPCAPPSSSRPMMPYSRSGIRTIAVMPRLPAAAHSVAATSVDIVLCSRSMPMKSIPEETMISVIEG